MRLHELTKELDADGKRLLEIAKELGLGVKSHSSNLPKGTEGILRAAWSEEAAEIARKSGASAKKEAVSDGPSIAVTLKSKVVEPAPEPEAEEVVAPTDEPASDTDAEADVAAGSADAAEVEVAALVAPAASTPEADAPASASQVEAEAEAEAIEASEPEAATGATEDEPVAAAAPAAPEHREACNTVVVTFGGQPQVHDEEEPPPPEEQRGKAVARRGNDADLNDEGVESRGVPNVPTSRDRKGAKILGRIELKKVDTERAPPRRGGETSFDPLDPTRAVADRHHVPEGQGR